MIADPLHSPTPAEALADLPGFVAGFSESLTVHSAAPMDPTEQLLADVLRLARLKGHCGILIQPDPVLPGFAAACVVDERSRPAAPSSDWLPSPNEALAHLFARLGK